MDTDEIYSQFDNIEEKVELLIERCKGLEATNLQMQSNIENLEKQLEEKSDSHDQNTKHKAVIRTKIEGLLAKLNNFSELSKESISGLTGNETNTTTTIQG